MIHNYYINYVTIRMHNTLEVDELKVNWNDNIHELVHKKYHR